MTGGPPAPRRSVLCPSVTGAAGAEAAACARVPAESLQADLAHRVQALGGTGSNGVPAYGAVEPRHPSAAWKFEQDLAFRALRDSVTPVLHQVLGRLGAAPGALGLRVDRLGAPRLACSSRSEVVLARLPRGAGVELPAGAADGRGADTLALVLKVGAEDRIAAEAEHAAWAARALGPCRVPAPRLPLPEARGRVAAIAQEHVRFADADEEAPRPARRASSALDWLLLGAGRFALEDARAALAAGGAGGEGPSAAAPPELPPASALGPPPPCAAEVRWVARQAAEVLAGLAAHVAPVGGQQRRQVVADFGSAALGAGFAPGVDEIGPLLLQLAPLLEKHVLPAHPSSVSPVHPSVRGLTEEYFPWFHDGRELSHMLDAASRLKVRLQEIHSAENIGCPVIPKAFLPFVRTHGRFSLHHLLLRDVGSADRKLELCVNGWSGLTWGPLYTDLAGLLTSIAFDAVRLPVALGDLAALYSASRDAGPAVPSALCAHHLLIDDDVAQRLLATETAPADDARSAAAASAAQCRQEFVDAIRGATGAAGAAASLAGGGPRDDAWLFAWLRADRASARRAAAEAGKLSDGLCDWRPPRGAASGAGAGGGAGGGAAERPGAPRAVPRAEPPPPPARRGRGEAPVRAVQFGWQALREFRDAVAAGLPAVEGDVDLLWPAMWCMPCLRYSLELLDSERIPWPQKVWLLSHIGRLVDRLLAFLDALASAHGRVQVRLSAPGPAARR